MNLNTNGTSYTSGICPKCGKLPYYVGDIPQGGFRVGLEPYCTCGTEICGKCGQRYKPECKHESNNTGRSRMTTENVRTKIEKVFTLSVYEKGTHRTAGWVNDDGEASFAESLSPMELMIESFKYRPLGTKIKVTMEEVD